MRVNARLDEESQRQIDYLTAATGNAVSQVLRESVSFYYRHVRAQRSGIENLSALIGKGDSGRSDIASDVKRRFAESVSAKHGVAGTQMLPAANPGPASGARSKSSSKTLVRTAAETRAEAHAGTPAGTNAEAPACAARSARTSRR